VIPGDVRHIHMIGICGTAMGAVAGMLKQSGYDVTGSDEHVYPPMSDVLASLHIEVMEGFSPSHLDPLPDLVVIGNAMSRGNVEVEAVLELRLPYVSLAETLREFFIRGNQSFVVSGTHGKTTASSLLAYVLDSAGREPGFMIGGVPADFESGARVGSGELFVTEGDEYDTAFFDKRSKFLHYLPDCLIVNNMEFDHCDIFGSIEEIELSFARVINIVPRNGLIIANKDDERVMALVEKAWCPVTTFSTSKPDADWYGDDLHVDDGMSIFTMHTPSGTVRCATTLHGRHNMANTLAVAAACSFADLTLDEIIAGVQGFGGIARRLQRLGAASDYYVYDDFAHHPTAIRETLAAVRSMHTGRRVIVLFEPRSNTTVRNIFQDDLADALSGADRVVIGHVHRLERVPEGQRLDLDRLLADLERRGTQSSHIDDPAEIVREVTETVNPGDVIVIMSNGAFGGISRMLPEALEHSPAGVGR
jgi:UDP-N-acetylmuramate: L-alanyl-gamma-D-glutamyl-meso-diaminopimelate ligase